MGSPGSPDGAAGPRRAGIVTLDLRHEVLNLALRDPFRIARSDHDAGHAVTTVVIELRDPRFPGLVGLGEGYPDRFYGETIETMAAIFPRLLAAIEGFEAAPDGVRAASDRLQGSIRWNGGAKCAVDTAMHDLAGKVSGMPVHRLLGLSTDIPPTDFTLGLDEPAVVAERAKRAGGFPALKIKCGGPADIATLEAVRAVYD
jgi:L-alanine-DL-glutamate epimerase-like enolase superfamily enzyme